MEFGRGSGFPGPSGQFESDPYKDGLPRKLDPGHQVRLPAGHGGPEPILSPETALMDTVARLQLDMEEMRAGSQCPSDTRWTDFTGPPKTGGVYVD